MLRKFVLGLAAAVAIGAAALSPTAASAGGHHGHGHHGGHGWHGGGWGGGWHGGGFHRRHHWGPRFIVSGGYGSCYVKRLVPTPYGYRYRLVNICY